jgi:CspA family cold shock protein
MYDVRTSRCAVAPCDRLLLELIVRECFVFGKNWRVTVTTGTVKKVVADRGFGFITASDAKEYFFHRNSLDSTLDFDRLVGGEAVTFEIEDSPKGPRANRVSAA